MRTIHIGIYPASVVYDGLVLDSSLGDLIFSEDRAPYFYCLSLRTKHEDAELLKRIKRVMRRLVSASIIDSDKRYHKTFWSEDGTASYKIYGGPYDDIRKEIAHQIYRLMNVDEYHFVQFSREDIEVYSVFGE
jgi:hypothetical protein